MINKNSYWNLRISKWAVRFLIPFFLISVVVVAAQELTQDKSPHKLIPYTQVMRQVNEAKNAKGDQNLDKQGLDKKSFAIQNLEQFIDDEADRLDRLGVSGEKQEKYFNLLQKQLESVAPEKKKRAGFFSKLFGGGDKKEETPASPLDVKMPKNPAKFQFNNEPIEIKRLKDTKVFPAPKQKLSNALLNLVTVSKADAIEINLLPVIEDVKADDKEIMITPEIREIAASMENNPVKIVNFVRNTITYEPYYGAKKGSVGCLAERVCNDVDASSLTISLLRAAGIPARYEKSATVFTVEQLRSLLGVSETKTAVAALAINKVPVFTLTDRLDGVNLDDADFGPETHLALEWTHSQAFYEYDERGANIANALDLSAGTTTSALLDILNQYSKKQWIPIDAIVQPYTHTQNNILADMANFNAENFWNSFYQYQGVLSPVGKYTADLLAATGQRVSDNLSDKSVPHKDFEILPATLPYFVGSGENERIQIPREKFSVLPDARRDQVRVSLRKESDDTVLLSRTFFGNEINNAKLNLYYEGLTDVDKAVIEASGGIHATPAALVDIAPYFQTDTGRYDGVQGAEGRLGAQIGDTLVLKFEYIVNGESVYDDEKFSVAGNSEGIFVSLSQVQADALLDDMQDENRNSHILLEGNTALAREYIKRVQEDSAFLKKSLDYEYNLQFGRAVVTQNRILNEIDGVPTTFDFKGLSIDAAAYIGDYSNRGNYKTHRKDFRLLWGQQASYMEGQFFKDVSGLDAISTVRGLQFANAHPETYTVHRITAANAGEIDALQLSDNTKANMRADVAAGNTILTPDKLVEDQAWRGVLYVSLRPDWTAQYAIGEQVAGNGGWTVENVQAEMYCDGLCKTTYQTSDGAQRFIHEDRFIDSVRCNITERLFLDITTGVNVPNDRPVYEKWSSEYGAPCSKETKSFGTVDHTFILATNAAKFYAVDMSKGNPVNLYNYWVKQDLAKQIILQDVNKSDENKFKFNLIAGTYSYNANEAIYYQPIQPTLSPDQQSWAENGRKWTVRGPMLNKLQERSYKPDPLWCNENDAYCSNLGYKRGFVLNKIGYPVSDELEAAMSYPFGTEGTYQSFIGGQIYYDTTWINNAYYVPGFIATEYNKAQYCQPDHGCGTGGTLGFPVDDPKYSEASNMIFQDFENGTRIKDFMDRPIQNRIETEENVQRIAIIRNYTDPAYLNDLKEGVMDAFAEYDVYGVGVNFAAGIGLDLVIKEFKSYIINTLGKKAAVSLTAKLTPAGWVFTIGVGALAIYQDWPLIQACKTDPDQTPFIEGKRPAYYCGKLTVYGFASVLGIVAGELGNRVINKFGVGTPAAREGKALLFSKVKDAEEFNIAKNAIINNPETREIVFRRISELDPGDIALLAEKPGVVKYLHESTSESIETFNGFGKQGAYAGAVKRKYHPKYKTKPYKKNPSRMETDYYTQQNAFDLPQMKAAGISKDGFYRIDELQDALNIYNNNNFATETFVVNGKTYYGEIIFVKKIDGTTILSPRRAVDTDFPHPYIAGGEDILCGGTIAPNKDGNPLHLVVTNKTGHYMSNENFEEMQWIIDELEGLGYTVKFEPEPLK